MTPLTVAFCTYQRADRLNKLVAALRAQSCPVAFDILAINNNSPDHTLDALKQLQQSSGAPLRVVTETAPGIVPARNRALSEAIDRDILVFIDDDELPQPGWLAAAYDSIAHDGAQCAGGRISVDCAPHVRPAWLDDELSGFLGEVDHGPDAFWIESIATPIWSGNVAYDMRLFRQDANLRFDARFNRAGEGVGGGEDAFMFRTLLARGARLRYQPVMAITHSVDAWKLRRAYFLKLHYRAGLGIGEHSLPAYSRTWWGIPPFLVSQFAHQVLRTLGQALRGRPALRQAMNAAHALGVLQGYSRRT